MLLLKDQLRLCFTERLDSGFGKVRFSGLYCCVLYRAVPGSSTVYLYSIHACLLKNAVCCLCGK